MVRKERNQEIDIMKGLLTLAMILCHCLQFFGKEDAGIEKILVNVGIPTGSVNISLLMAQSRGHR